MRNKIIISFALLAILWLLVIADTILPGEFYKAGIEPRSTSGLFGILFAPFIHANFSHILSNSLPIFLLTLALLIFYEKIAFQVWIFSALIGGALTWLLAQLVWDPTPGVTDIHFGVSGVIFSLIGFFIASGIFRRSLKSILLAIIVLFIYGGTVLTGVLPINPYISWQGHLF